MAAISKDNRFIFLHIYRTGGNTIRRLLGLMDRKAEIYGVHCLGSHVRQHFVSTGQLDIWNNALKFSVIRNPFTWLVSTFNYILASKRHQEHEIAERGFSFFLHWLVDMGMQEDRKIGVNRYALFCDFLLDEHGEPLIDTIIRFEHFNSHVGQLCKRLGMPVASVPVVNPSRYVKRSYRDYYSPDDVDLVQRAWQRDFEYFGYEGFDS